VQKIFYISAILFSSSAALCWFRTKVPNATKIHMLLLLF